MTGRVIWRASGVIGLTCHNLLACQPGRSQTTPSRTIRSSTRSSLDILKQNLKEALEQRPPTRFPPQESFVGAGLYALYYRGSLPLYAKLRDHKNIPIYVGKAEAGNSSYGDPPDELQAETV